MKEVKWLLVGAGDIAAKRLAAALSQAPRSRLAGVCDIREANARELAERFAAPEVFADFDAALKETTADAVYVATPVWLHADQTIRALRAGKHVIVEKPLGRNVGESRAAVRAAAVSGKHAACAYFRRFAARYQLARKMLEDNSFGKVVLVRMLYFSWFNPADSDPKRWRVVRERSGGGILADMGSHMFDVLIGLFGMPQRVYARCGNLVHAWDVEDCASILMTLANGAHVTASFNWNSKTWRHEFEIVGTEAKLNWLPYDSGPVTRTVGRQTDSLEMKEPENVHLPLVADFVEAVLDNRPPLVPLDEALKTDILIDAVYRSARENREIVLGAE